MPEQGVVNEPDSPNPGGGLTLEMVKAEVLSPFLAKTYIQYAWDSTSLELLKRCPRLYQYVMIEGWEPHGEGIHLRFGIEYHQALHDYETYLTLELNHDEAVCATVHDLLTRIHSWDPDPRTASEEKKSKANLIRTVVWYLDQFKDDPAKTVMLDNGKPGLEVSFRFQLDFGPASGVNLPSNPINTAQPYLLCGHLDRIVRFQGDLFVMDRKTSGSALSQYYFAQYHPHNQMSLYTLAGKVVLETPVRGVIIDGAFIFDNWTESAPFQRGVTYRTQDQINEWLLDLSWYLGQAEAYATQGYWPMNDTSCDKYGGCKFRDICNKSPHVREHYLKSGFRQKPKEERWNPLRPR